MNNKNRYKKEIVRRDKKNRLIKSDIKLTIGMLVSNHIQYIRKAMEALKPLLEAVPSELVVIDTEGEKTDGSIEVVREYTDKIFPFTWCNDFSAARNYCLNKSKGEWFLYVDDDEWFDDVTEFIDFFKTGECEKYYSGYYYTRDYLPEGGYSTGIAGRMIRRTENTCFIGRVHETFNETFAPNKQFSCFTHHYGYAYETEDARLQKQQRNLSILEKEIEEEGITPKRAAQVIQELLVRDETTQEGFERCQKYILEINEQGNIMHSCSQWLLTASVRSFAESGCYEEQLRQAATIRSKYPLTEIAQMVLAATLIQSAIEENDYETIEKELEIYLKNWDWQKVHPEEALLQTQLDFPRFLTDDYYYRMVHLAAVVANHKKDYQCANQYWKRMPWKQEGFNPAKYQEDLNITVEGLKQLKTQKILSLQNVEQQRQKEKKKEWCLMLQTVLEAMDYANNAILKANYEELNELFSGMQEIAITVGQNIDECFGEGTQEVSLLEEFCESVWRCSQAEQPEVMLAYLKNGRQIINKVMEKLR